MANFPALKMTAAGRELQAKAQTGQVLKFTRVALGDGQLVGSIDALTALVSEKQSLAIRDQTTPGDGTSILNVIATNKGVQTGFYVREVGTFAEDPDTLEELLYSYTNAAAESDFLPAEGGSVTYESLFDLITVVGNAENVTAVIDDYITIALKSEVEALRPFVLPVGGLVDDILVKASNRDGESKWVTVSLAGLQLRFGSVEEWRVATEGQRVFSLDKTLTNGLGVYVEGKRVRRDVDWVALSAKQLQMTDPQPAGTRILFVNNEEMSASAAIDVTLDGPALVYASSSNTFTITNYDSSALYDVTSSVGTVSRTKDVITLTVPAGQAAGTLDLSVSRDGVKKTRKIAIGAAAIMAPQITSPVNGATGVLFEPNITTSAFTVYPVGYDQHVKTQWQIATDAAFTALFVDLTTPDYKEALPLASIQKRLDPAKRYYVRARHIGNTLTGAWASVSYFNTAAMYVRKPTISAPLDGADKVSLSFTFKCDAFAVAGGADQHIASRWQLSLYSDFRSLIEDTGWSATKLLSFTPAAALARKTNHYIRVAQKGQVAGESEWSAAIGFTSAAPLAGTSTLVGSGATARYEHTVTNVDGSLYVFGGYSSDGGLALGQTLFKYDPVGNVWQQKASFTSPRLDHAACALNGMLYVFGGSADGGSTPLGDLLRYDPATNKWVTLQAGPPARRAPWMVESGGYLYVGGGSGVRVNTGNPPTVDLWRYNPTTNTWAQLASPAASTAFSLAGAIAGKIYVLRATQRLENIDIYDIATDKWSVGALSVNSVAWSSMAVVSGLLYTMGGVDGGNGSGTYRKMQEYDPATDKWRVLPDFPVTRYFHSACELNGAMYVYGGQNNNPNVAVNTLYRVD